MIACDTSRTDPRLSSQCGKVNTAEGGVYHDLRLADPIVDPTWIDRFKQ